MIARTWRGAATMEKAADYRRHFTTNVVPHLKALAGQRGAYLLQREGEEEVEFLVLTLWDSVEDVQAFAGQNLEVAVVEPEAQIALSRFDEFVRHYEVAYSEA